MPATIRDRAERTQRSLTLIYASTAALSTEAELRAIDRSEVLPAVHHLAGEALEEIYWLTENVDDAVLDTPALDDDDVKAAGTDCTIEPAVPAALEGPLSIEKLRVTPAMEAGVPDHVWSVDEIVALLG